MTRKELEALGLDKEVVDTVMSLNGEALNKVKQERDDLATKYTEVQKKLNGFEGAKTVEEYTEMEKQLNEAKKLGSTLETKYNELETLNKSNSSELAKYQTKDTLIGLNVDKNYIDYVAFEVQRSMGEGSVFADEAKKYIEDNNQFLSGTVTKVNTAVTLGNGTPAVKTEAEQFNEAIRNAHRGK